MPIIVVRFTHKDIADEGVLPLNTRSVSHPYCYNKCQFCAISIDRCYEAKYEWGDTGKFECYTACLSCYRNLMQYVKSRKQM